MSTVSNSSRESTDSQATQIISQCSPLMPIIESPEEEETDTTEVDSLRESRLIGIYSDDEFEESDISDADDEERPIVQGSGIQLQEVQELQEEQEVREVREASVESSSTFTSSSQGSSAIHTTLRMPKPRKRFAHLRAARKLFSPEQLDEESAELASALNNLTLGGEDKAAATRSSDLDWS